MPFINRIYMIAVLAVGTVAVTGYGPVSGTTASSETPAMAASDTSKAKNDECAGWGGRHTFAYRTARPETIQRCAALKGPGGTFPLNRIAGAAFHDTPNADATRALLEAGADPNARSATAYRSGMAKPSLLLFRTRRVSDMAFEWRVLHAAIASHRPPPSIAALLEHDADPNLTVAPGQDDWTALHVAAFVARPDVIRLLLAHGADPHAVTTSRKWTAPHALAAGATGPGAAPVGHLLLDAGIDPKLRDRKGQTAWDLVRTRLTPEQIEASPPESRQVLARLQTATRG